MAVTTPSFYLSGPMTGIADSNFPHFNTVAAALRLWGYTVINPAEINAATSGDWHNCLRADLKALCDCSGLILLSGWERSKGAHLELHVAHRLGLTIQTLNDFLKERGHDPI